MLPLVAIDDDPELRPDILDRGVHTHSIPEKPSTPEPRGVGIAPVFVLLVTCKVKELSSPVPVLSEVLICAIPEVKRFRIRTGENDLVLLRVSLRQLKQLD